ncbi:hypothetical protein CesoFtcFv8_007106 [Champsocephalus esox]|uniref:Uncharacterized protein n=1 Tax=Champsocephalus esox TaxID=159716 RepID=A0AAN8CDA4_9TELE|nr:hypothetical protein CesoFtcFv8_007106 [Champsocephalus esox]
MCLQTSSYLKATPDQTEMPLVCVVLRALCAPCGQTAATCLIGEEQSELLCLELLRGDAILSEAILLQLST